MTTVVTLVRPHIAPHSRPALVVGPKSECWLTTGPNHPLVVPEIGVDIIRRPTRSLVVLSPGPTSDHLIPKLDHN